MNSTICVSFDWAPTWRSIELLLGVAAASETRSTCMWPPRSVLANPGLHELLGRADTGGAGGLNNATWRMHKSVPRLMRQVRASGIRSFTSQLVAIVQPRALPLNLGAATNADIHAYNEALQTELTRSAGEGSSQLCINLFDAYAMSHHLNATGQTHAPDGVHWHGLRSPTLYRTRTAAAASRLVCQPPQGPSCIRGALFNMPFSTWLPDGLSAVLGILPSG